MILYLDTSLIVASIVMEVSTFRVQEWLGRQDADELHISDWVVTEFSAALAMKLRTGQIDVGVRAIGLSAFANLQERSLSRVPVSEIDFQVAAQFADMYESGLRAGDALHMAISRRVGAQLCTLDVRLAEAGTICGVPTLLV